MRIEKPWILNVCDKAREVSWISLLRGIKIHSKMELKYFNMLTHCSVEFNKNRLLNGTKNFKMEL